MTARPITNKIESELRTLYKTLLDCWNRRDADSMAALLEQDATLIGFDGSQMNGQSEARATLKEIFADHPTASYVAIIRDTRLLTHDVAVLRAAVGMVPPGQHDINPAVNAIQTVVAIRRNDEWRIAVFQNTPAAFHGRPELAAQLTEDLRRELKGSAK